MPGKQICNVCGQIFHYHGKRKPDRCKECGWDAWMKAHFEIKSREGEAYEKWKAGMIKAANRGK